MEKKSKQRPSRNQGRERPTAFVPEKKSAQKRSSPATIEKQYEQESTNYHKWLYYAEQDVKAAEVLMTALNEFPNQAITLAIQSSEKSLKAYLIFKKIKISRTHDILKLFDDCKKSDSDFDELDPSIHKLNTQPPGQRYPSTNIVINSDGISNYKRKVVKMCIESAQHVYKFVVDKIDIDEQTASAIDKIIKPSKNALFKAVQQDNTEEAELLMQQGVNINERNEDGNTALIIAVDLCIRNRPSNWIDRQKNKAMAKLLLKNNALVNIQNNEGETALFYAAGVARPHLATHLKPPTAFSSLKLVKLLLRYGADVTIKNTDGETVFTVKQMPHIRRKNIFELLEKHQ